MQKFSLHQSTLDFVFRYPARDGIAIEGGRLAGQTAVAISGGVGLHYQNLQKVRYSPTDELTATITMINRPKHAVL